MQEAGARAPLPLSRLDKNWLGMMGVVVLRNWRVPGWGILICPLLPEIWRVLLLVALALA